MPDLSPSAQAVMIAATNGNFNVVNDPVYKQCIAAALRAAADQCADGVTHWELYAIAAELEGNYPEFPDCSPQLEGTND